MKAEPRFRFAANHTMKAKALKRIRAKIAKLSAPLTRRERAAERRRIQSRHKNEAKPRY